MPTPVLIPGTLSAMRAETAAALEQRGYEPVYMGELEDADIVCGQSYVDNDVCVAALAAIGQTIRFLKEHEDSYAVLAAEICKECRAVSMTMLLPDALQRAGITVAEVVQMTCADLASAVDKHDVELDGLDKAVVGIAGNTAMLSSPLYTRTIVERLQANGCETVFPPLGLVINEQDFLEPLLAWFDSKGIRTVICMLAFGCLGGHAYARGKARRLREQFPEVELTMLDYDRDASDVNLVNRTELVIQSAKERGEDR